MSRQRNPGSGNIERVKGLKKIHSLMNIFFKSVLILIYWKMGLER